MFYGQAGCARTGSVELMIRNYGELAWRSQGRFCSEHATTSAYRRFGFVPGGWHYSGRVRFRVDGVDVRPVRGGWEPTDHYAADDEAFAADSRVRRDARVGEGF